MPSIVIYPSLGYQPCLKVEGMELSAFSNQDEEG
jgi:hypothetical protein